MAWQIAIDGPAASGKSSVSRLLAKKLQFKYLDTGAMYRAVTLKALRLGIDLENEDDYKFLEETKIDFVNDRIYLDGVDVSLDIRSLEVSNNVSIVSKIPCVRKTLVNIQKRIADSDSIVMDGRDIGTVVLPNAFLKIYLYASVEVRALRRLEERKKANAQSLDLQSTIEEIIDRDNKDSSRKISPLRQAEDAVLIDTSEMDVEEVIEKITSLVLKRGYQMENLETKNGTTPKSQEEATVEVVKEKKPRAKKVVKEAETEVKTEEVKTEAVSAETVSEEKPVKKTRAKKVTEPKAEEVKTDEVKAEEVKTEEVKAEETTEPVVKTRKPRAKKVATEEVKAEEVKAEEVKAEEVKAEEVKAEEVKAEENATEEKPVKKPRAKKATVTKEVETPEGEVVPVESLKEEPAKKTRAKKAKVEEVSEAEEVKVEPKKPVEVVIEPVSAFVDFDESRLSTGPYREMAVVKGKIAEVYSAQPEKKVGKKVIKAKEERVLVVLDDGQEGYLFKRDTPLHDSKEELFDHFIEGDDIVVVIRKMFPDGGKFIFSTLLLQKYNELIEYEKTIKDRPLTTMKVQKHVAPFGFLGKMGKFNCILPLQLSSASKENPQEFLNQEVTVVPIRVDFTRFRVIVSQNHASSKIARLSKKQFLQNIKVGNVYNGTIKSIESYGAFVELAPGVEGLLHISEIDHKRVNKVDKVLAVGDNIEVSVLKVDKEHIGLSRKALLTNYWDIYFAEHKLDEIVTVEVLEVSKVGLRVCLYEDVEGFIPRSEYSWERDNQMEEVVKVNDKLEAVFVEVDKSKRRVILSSKKVKPNPWQEIRVYEGDIVEVTISKVTEEGYKVDYFGITGYMSKGTVKSRDPESIKEGEIIRAKIRIFDANKQRFVLSMRDAEEKLERDNYSKYMKNQDKISNTLGDFFTRENKKNKK